MARLGLGCLVLVLAVLTLGLSRAEVAYRLTCQNGNGGTIAIPMANRSAEEEAVHLPPPTPPGPTSLAPSAVPANATQGVHETVRLPVEFASRTEADNLSDIPLGFIVR
ncbi:MAG TPA: hypothetical protein VLM91_15380 [Candidatus Methylomirabilis sp.]|nr:hypothetical protein [Candidatus Methylomirabilis sp.]